MSLPITRDALVDLIAAGLRGTYHCGRVWEAWSVGTMSQQDFEPVDESDTPGEIADAVLALLAAAAEPVQWGDPRTVGMFVRQLQTIDPAAPIYAAFHAEYQGKSRAMVRGITLSRERVKGRFIESSDKSVPYAHVVWSQPQADAAEPWNGLKGLPTLRSVIGLLRETGRYVDEEGENTDSLNDLVAWVEKQAAGNLVPGQMHCARCKFQLTRVNLYVGNGSVGAGDSKTEPCPNGCGPLWPVTWEQAARDAWAAGEALFERAKEAEDALAAVSPPRLVSTAPKVTTPTRDCSQGCNGCEDCIDDDAPLETGEGDAR